MRFRTRASIVGVALTISSTLASALGLGEIKLNTALNQPLVAEVPLLNVKELTDNEVLVSLASNEEFARVGVDKTYFISELDFKVDLNAPGGPKLYISSEQPVTEPFLDFVIQVQWPSGKLLREYTVLLDLPVYSDVGVKPIQAPVQQQAPAQPAARPAQSVEDYPVLPRPAAAYANRRSGDLVGDDEYGPTSSSDNLWTIASRTKPSGVSIQQAMIAIQQVNPNAFIRGNINLLKKGQVLRIPGEEEMRELNRSAAVQAVAQQNTAFQTGDYSAPVDLPQLEGSKSFSPTRDEETAVEGRVKLTSGSEDSETVGSGVEAEVEGLKGELSVTQEELDAAMRENTELRDRVRSMEEQIETMEKLIELNSTEMRALELAAAQANEASAEEGETSLEETVEQAIEDGTESLEQELTEAAEGVSEEASEMVEEGVELAETMEEMVSEENTAETSAEAEQQAEETAAPVTTAPPVQQIDVPKAKPKSIMEIAQDNMLYILIGLGVLVVGVIGFWFSRRQNDGFDDEFDEFEDELDSADNEFPEEDDEDDSTVVMGHGDLEDDSDDLDLGLDNDMAADEEDSAPAEAETEDVVAECDIHFAYGQYDQAEEKLLKALSGEPANTEMRLKLLEVYAAQENIHAFDENYAKLLLLNDDEANERASAMRADLDAGDFDAGSYDVSDFAALIGVSAVAASAGSAGDYDLDLDLDIEDDEDKTQIAPPKSESDELGLDLDLDEDDTSDLDIDLNESISLDTDDNDESLLDLDLDLDDDDKESLTPEFSGSLVSENDDISNIQTDDLDLDIGDLEEEAESSADDEIGDFNLDADLDNILSEDTSEEADSKDGLDIDGDLSAELEDLELGDLDDPVETSDDSLASDSALDADLDLDGLGEGDLETAGLETDLLEPSSLDDTTDDLDLSDLDEPDSSTTAEEPALADDLDLDGDLNLDDIDQELDELASGFDGDLGDLDTEVGLDAGDAAAELDDLDLGDLDADLDSTEAAPESAADAPSEEAPKPAAASAAADDDFELPDFDPEEDDDSNLDFLSDNDEVATKLDLARAYIDMGDAEGAKDIISEIMEEGSADQKSEAQGLLEKI